MVKDYFEEESEERKEYIKFWFKKAINGIITKDKIENLKNLENKNQKQKDLIEYYKGLNNKGKDSLIKYLGFEKYDKLEFKEYITKSGNMGYISDKKVLAYNTIENKKTYGIVRQYLYNGKLRTIIQNKNGRFLKQL